MIEFHQKQFKIVGGSLLTCSYKIVIPMSSLQMRMGDNGKDLCSSWGTLCHIPQL